MNQLSNLNQLAIEINVLKEQTARNIVEIGNRLIKVKNSNQYGNWGNWLKDNVDMSHNQANRFMRISREFPNYATSHNLNISKAFELLSIPTENREEFIENNDVEDMTTRELREAIKREKLLKEENLAYQEQIKELSNQEPKVVEIEKEVVPKDYIQTKRDLDTAIEAAKYQKDRAERIYKDNQRLLIENEKNKKSEVVSEFDTKLNTTAMSLSMRTKKFLEDVGGMVWINDYYSQMDETDRKMIEISINSLFGWVMSMKNQIEEDKT